jgi:hypothetical protein
MADEDVTLMMKFTSAAWQRDTLLGLLSNNYLLTTCLLPLPLQLPAVTP